MAFETLTGLVFVVAVGALLGAMAGSWFGRRRSVVNSPLEKGFQELSTLVEQTGKTIRESLEALRGALAGTERALSSKVEDGQRAGFDRTLVAISDGAKAQNGQIDAFRSEVATVSAAMTRLGTGVPALLEAARANAKLDAAAASKILCDELAAAFRQYGLDQGTKLEILSGKVEVSGAAVAKAVADFQASLTDSLGKVQTTVTRIGGEMTTTLAENQTKTTKALTEDLTKLSDRVDQKMTEMRMGNEVKLLEIQGIVDQKLQEGIEKRMTEAFAKITTQFAEVQQAVGEVRTVAGQVGDLKRLFSNVKSRGGWSEAQVKAALDDVLPPGSYETNKCVNPATADAVEFALKLPMQGGGAPVYLAVDAKFPTEDYTRLLEAAEASDLGAEKAARTALEARIRQEAKKIQCKYIAPPHTVEWAILYLPSEGLYAEVTRNSELIEVIHRDHRVVIMGPSMLAVMLRTIQLGHFTLAIGQKAELIGQILGAVKHEMVDFGRQFNALEKNVQALGNNIKKGRTRANVISRKLRDVAALEGPAAAEVLEWTAADGLLAHSDHAEAEAAE
jgi:DNA recombination protein RmuC